MIYATVLTSALCTLFEAGDLKEALWTAARNGDVATIKKMIAQGVDVNAKSAYGATALSFAADKGHIEVVELLLAHKADVNVKDTFYQATPLSWAISKNHPKIVKLLVEAGAEDSDAALLYAAGRGHADLVRTILDKAKTKPGTRDRALAAAKKHPEVRELLVKAGAKENDSPKIAVDAKALAGYEGTYRSDEMMLEVKIAVGKTGLRMDTGGFVQELQPAGKLRFHPAGNEALSFEFQKQEEKIAGFVQKSGKVETIFRRVEPVVRAKPSKVVEGDIQVKKPRPWPQFRGANAAGVADGQFPPVTWDAASGHNIRWKTPIPGLGHSCPVVWGHRIFLTTAVGDDKAGLKPGRYGNVDSVMDKSVHAFHVLCLDKNTGKVLWDEVVHKGVPKVKRHLKATHANCTCATDGKHVIACFGSEGLYCLDMSGRLVWKQELGLLDAGWFYDAEYQWGYGSSPIIYKDCVIVQCDAGKNAFIAAYDLATGKQIWQTPRDEIPSWGTPTVIVPPDGKRPELVTNATKFVRGYDPVTGEELWRLGRNSEITVPTPFFAQGLIFAVSGYRPPRPIWAIRPGARGDITPPKGESSNSMIAWSDDKAGTYMPTPIVYGDYLYTAAATCYDARTGKRLWWERLASDAGFTASPVAADGKLYFCDEAGLTFVLKAGPAFDLVAVNALNDPCLATPAISDGMIFIRTQRYLFGIGRK